MRAPDTKTKQQRTRPPYDPNADIIRPRHISAAVGFSSTTAWRLRKLGLFPEPIRLSARCIGWRRADIERWLAGRAEGR